jgi:hypothetical protein
MVQQRFIGKASKECVSTSSLKGSASEKNVSQVFHQQGIPLLISAKVLRSRGCGQIDLARFVESQKIECLEVKSSVTGLKTSIKQRYRILKSSDFLAKVFNSSISMRYFVSKSRTLCEK